MEIVEIMDVAKGKNALKSDRALARAIGISAPTLIRIRQGWGYPSEQNMMKLGELAGIDRASALLLLNMWKAEGEAKNTYRDILSRISAAALCFVMLIVATPANASINKEKCYVNSGILYIMENTVYFQAGGMRYLS